jgi:hypothetical protein
MVFEEIVKHIGNQTLISQAILNLKQSHYFSAALEMSFSKSDSLKDADPMVKAAMQRYFQEGYKEALEDLFFFMERYVKPDSEQIKANYGAVNKLLAKKDITAEEAAILRKGV